MWLHFPKLNPRAGLGGATWTGEAPRAGLGGSLQLFKWTWETTRPDVKLNRLDFVYAMTRAAPFLTAITAE